MVGRSPRDRREGRAPSRPRGRAGLDPARRGGVLNVLPARSTDPLRTRAENLSLRNSGSPHPCF